MKVALSRRGSHITGLRNIVQKRECRRYLHLPTAIKEIREKGQAGEKVTVRGWIRSIRSQKNVSFIHLNDGSCLSHLQIIFPGDTNLKDITYGAAVECEGQLVSSPGALQRVEVQGEKIRALGENDAQNYPIQQRKHHTMEFLREIGHLRPRTNTFGALLRIRNKSSMYLRSFLQELGFVEIYTPVLTASDCEGAGEVFRVLPKMQEKGPKGEIVEYFGKETYLTVSGQLQAEALACAMSRVYTFGPTFRAEPSQTRVHLSEFTMLEPEIAFANLDTILDLSEQMVKNTIHHLLENCTEDLEFLDKGNNNELIKSLKEVSSSNFERIPYAEAISLLKKSPEKFQFPIEYGLDLQKEHEKYLVDTYFKKPLFVYNWPKSIKPFYMKLNEDGETVGAMDLLVPNVGEIIGGSVREDRYNLLKDNMDKLSLNKNGQYDWYLDLRKYGSAPHAGFGLGFERFLQFVTGTKNIRDSIPFPRHKGYCEY